MATALDRGLAMTMRWETIRIPRLLLATIASDDRGCSRRKPSRLLPALAGRRRARASSMPSSRRAPASSNLGCGTGRIAGPLVTLGHEVTGVDNGLAMIAALPPDVEGIVGDARTIRLGRRFGAVLLASHLVNHPRTAPRSLRPRPPTSTQRYPRRGTYTQVGSFGVRRTRDRGRVTGGIETLRASVLGDVLKAEVRTASTISSGSRPSARASSTTRASANC